MRLTLVAAVLVAALMSVVNAQAYRTGVTTHAATIQVATTDAAAVGLSPGAAADGNAAGTAYFSGPGQEALYLNFRKGFGGAAAYGFGPQRTEYAQTVAGDKYHYRDLFRVTNNTGGTKCIYVYVPGGGVAELAGIYVRAVGDPGTGTLVTGAGGTRGSCVNTGGGASLSVDFWWDFSASTASGLYSMNVRVEGQR